MNLLHVTLAAGAALAGGLQPAHRFYLSPQEERDFDTRALAEAIVGRVREECDLAGDAPAGGAPVAEGADIIMMVPGEILPRIAKEGFLNQHVTATTKGFHRDRFALEQELAMARLPYDDKGKRLLPKYAVLDLAGPDVGKFELPTRYGDVAFVFKPDVAARATWTYADSLDFSAQAGHFSPSGDANPVLPRTFGYRRKPKDLNRCGNYCEAQIWGELDLRDVAYAMVPGRSAPSALKRAGVRVYRYSLPESSSTIVAPGRAAQYIRGNLIEAGAPEKTTGPDLFKAGPAPDEGVLFSIWRSTDSERRAQALHAFGALQWERLKPFVFAGLGDKSPLVVTEAIALASEHLDDADIARALRVTRRAHLEDHELAVEEWISRLTKKRFCD